MTVSTTTNKVSYVGNGIATEFSIPFPYLETAHLKVYQLLNDIQTQRDDWTVQNGNLIFEAAPANGAQIVIMRIVPFTQETDYQENEILAAETLERNFDSLTMQVQQLKELSERAVTVDIFDDTPAAELLPSIRSAVSDAASYAQAASEKANNAEASSEIATAQANIAMNKANEATFVLSNKAEKDLSNCTRPYISETYRNGTQWYRLWSDGWIEQGGHILSGTHLIFQKPFTTTDYTIVGNETGRQAEDNNCRAVKFRSIQASTCYVIAPDNPVSISWYACGY